MSNMLGNIFQSESFQASHEEAFLETGAFWRKWAEKKKKMTFLIWWNVKHFQEISYSTFITTFFKKFVDQDVVLVKVGPAVLSVWRWLDHNHYCHCHHHHQYHHNEHHPDRISWLSSSPGCGAFHASCMEEEEACVPVCLWGKVGAATCVLPSSFIGHLSWVLARTLNFHTLQIHTICWGVHLDMSCPLPTSFILRTTYKLYRSPLLHWPGL